MKARADQNRATLKQAPPRPAPGILADNHWRLSSRGRRVLRPFLESPPSSWKLETLKRTGGRAVYRGWAWGEERVFVKSFPPPHGLKRLLRRFKGLREWTTLHWLAERGIPVPQPLGLCREPGGREWLFMAKVAGKPLTSLQCHPDRLRGKRSMITSLARLLRALHQLGLQDPDRHGGNFLLSKEGQIACLDFHRARLRHSLRGWEKYQSLLILDSSLLGQFTPRDRIRFLKEYWGHPFRVGSAKGWIRKLHRRSLLRRQRKLFKKARQSLTNSRRFERLNLGMFQGFLRRGTSVDQIRHALHSYEGLVANREIKRGSRTLVVECPTRPAFIVKGYLKRGLLARARSFLGFSRARRAWRNAFLLEQAGVPTARTVAMLHGPGVDVLISEKVPGGVHLNRYLAEFAESRAQRQRISHRLASLVAGIHLAGCRGRDLRAENLLVRPDTEEVFLVDFDGIRPGGRQTPLRDLARLCASFPRLAEVERRDLLRKYRRILAPWPGEEKLRTLDSRLVAEMERIWKGWKSAPKK